jgi:hypothetical protein
MGRLHRSITHRKKEACRGGLSEWRSKMLSRRASRPKREPIAQKGLLPIRIPRPKVSPPLIFDAKYPLTGKKSHPILRTVKLIFNSCKKYNERY